MQEFDKRLSDKIKQELGSYEPEFNPAHWGGMQQKLAAARRLYWLKLISAIGSVIILGGICAWCFFKMNTADEISNVSTGVFQKDTVLSNVESLIQPQYLDSIQENNDKNTQQDNASVFESDQQKVSQYNTSVEVDIKERKTTNSLQNSKSYIEENRKIKQKKEANIDATTPKNDSQANDEKKTAINNLTQSIKEIDNTKNQTEIARQSTLIDSVSSINSNSVVESVKSTVFDNQELIYIKELLPADSLKYYQWTDSIPKPLPTIIPHKSIENKPTEPASKYELGFLTGVSLLNAESSSTLGLNMGIDLNYFLHKRTFLQASVDYQIHTLKTNHSAYIPTDIPSDLPTFIEDTLSVEPSVPESAFRDLQYEPMPLAYQLPVYSFTTSIGYHVYQSEKLNVFTALGLTNYIWGKVTVEPYTESNAAQNADYLYISSSLASANIVGNYPVEYSAFSHSDLLGAWKTQLGAQYKINNKLSISSSIWYERSFGEISPVAFKMSRFGFKSGILISLN